MERKVKKKRKGKMRMNLFLLSLVSEESRKLHLRAMRKGREKRIPSLSDKELIDLELEMARRPGKLRVRREPTAKEREEYVKNCLAAGLSAGPYPCPNLLYDD